MPVPVYSPEELAERIAEGSVDINRLAETTLHVMRSVDAVVTWVNRQIQTQQTEAQAQGPGAATTAPDAEAGKRRR